ncbi:PTS system protein [Klebsiella pneumoniae]|uniref:PTS system protein n=1 Tax=Klebsiella pneumoniae TaxID=573 RepID=A0A377TGU4_KLEPN|nr:PTS system protein [Klebsiella pneumoniae]
MPEIRQRILENMQKFSRAMIGARIVLAGHWLNSGPQFSIN